MYKSKTTKENTFHADISGDKLYQIRARKTLPILVRQAKAEQPITYTDLAKELEMPNARNLNYVLGAIGNSLNKLKTILGYDIPIINAIVVNKSTGLPGVGIEGFLESKEKFDLISKNQKKAIINIILKDIFIFSKWDDILNELKLSNVDITYTNKIPSSYSPIAESQSHKNFKERISKNPSLIGLSNKPINVEIEFSFPTQDEVDVLFNFKNEVVGVEVKSKISKERDIRRGLFQCIKYQALLEANQKLEQKPLNVDTILALEAEFPKSLLPIKHLLGITVIDRIGNTL